MGAGRADVESDSVGGVVKKNLAEDIENKEDKQCTDRRSVDSPLLASLRCRLTSACSNIQICHNTSFTQNQTKSRSNISLISYQ